MLDGLALGAAGATVAGGLGFGIRGASTLRGDGATGAGGGAASMAAPVSAGGVNALPHCGHGVD
jgi:hypothetical protein